MKDEELSKLLLKVPLIFILVFLLGLFKAYVVTQLWGWFMVQRMGLAPLPVMVAWGILVMVSMLKGYTKDEKEASSLDIIFDNLVTILLGWFFGYLIHLAA